MKKFAFLIVCSILFSCSDVSLNENIESSPSSLNRKGNNFNIYEGILVFDSKEDLKSSIEELNNLDDDQLREYFLPLYNKGFNPLYLNFDEELDENLMNKFIERKKAKLDELKFYSPEYYNEEELMSFDDDIISDDNFASFLNDRREIIVDGNLYRYTYNGLYRAELKSKNELDNFIDEKKLDVKVTKNITNSTFGFQQITNNISVWIPSSVEMALPNSGQYGNQEQLSNILGQTPGLNLLTQYNPNDDYSGGGGQTSNPSSSYKINSQVNFMNNLEPCHSMNGFLNSFFGVFGDVRKCHDYFSNSRRTKTKYWKETYFVYNSIGVKVKHQKFKNVLFGAGWWYASKTDEVALSISQASFKFTMPIQNFPQLHAAPKLMFFDGKIFNSNGQLLNYANNYSSPTLPVLPFNSEVVITEFVNTLGVDISHEQLRTMFYSGLWNGANQLVNQYKQRDAKNVTHVLYTPTTIYVNYVNLEKRKLNSKKIVDRLDYNFGLGLKFNVYFDGNGNYSTNLGNFASNPFGYIILPSLYDYKSVKMDFVGATRNGNTWKGSRIVYTD